MNNPPLPFDVPAPVLAAARKIKLALFDVDGVLTDGRLIVGDDGQEYKAFHSRDGHGIKMLMHSGVEVGIITGRTSRVVEHRVRDLDIPHVFQGCENKLETYGTLRARLGLSHDAIAFMGDDVVDLAIMLRVGLAVTVQDGHHLVKRHAHWVTPSPAGRGAARDLCEMLLVAQGTYDAEMARFV